MKLLMIANSFGVNLQRFANKLADSNGLDLDIYVLYIGGCTLNTHVKNIKEDASAYELFHNGETTGKMISIKEALLMDKWDYVSMQQASHQSGILETYYPSFGIVYNLIKELSPNSEIIFHKTWAYSKYNSNMFETVPTYEQRFTFKTSKEMKDAIDKCVSQVSSEFDIKKIIGSGDVIFSAEPVFGSVYDQPGFHLNDMGCYLIGCNLVKMLSGKKLTSAPKLENIGAKTCQDIVDFINNNF